MDDASGMDAREGARDPPDQRHAAGDGRPILRQILPELDLELESIPMEVLNKLTVSKEDFLAALRGSHLIRRDVFDFMHGWQSFQYKSHMRNCPERPPSRP